MVDAALVGLEGNAFSATNAELVAWSVKTDQLGTPPRLFEDAVVLAHVVASGGTNKWILAYIRSMVTGGLRGHEWQRLYYPPLVKAPVLSLSEFSRNPTDEEIADFIRATDFGYNSFNPREKVLDLVVYRARKKILETIQESIPPAEKQKRYFDDQRIFMENFEPPKR